MRIQYFHVIFFSIWQDTVQSPRSSIMGNKRAISVIRIFKKGSLVREKYFVAVWRKCSPFGVSATNRIDFFSSFFAEFQWQLATFPFWNKEIHRYKKNAIAITRKCFIQKYCDMTLCKNDHRKVISQYCS